MWGDTCIGWKIFSFMWHTFFFIGVLRSKFTKYCLRLNNLSRGVFFVSPPLLVISCSYWFRKNLFFFTNENRGARLALLIQVIQIWTFLPVSGSIVSWGYDIHQELLPAWIKKKRVFQTRFGVMGSAMVGMVWGEWHVWLALCRREFLVCVLVLLPEGFHGKHL